MKLNADCIRDLLLFLETQPFYKTADLGSVTSEPVFLSQAAQALPEYPVDELYYTLLVLGDGGYLQMEIEAEGNNEISCCVYFITYRGHELLNSIRDSNQWATVKKCLSAVRNYSLSAIQAVASGITETAIAAYVTKNQI